MNIKKATTNIHPRKQDIQKLQSIYIQGKINEAEIFAIKLSNDYPKSYIILNIIGTILIAKNKIQDSIKYLGGYPHFIDCEENYPNIDSDKLEEYLNKNCILKNGRCVNKKTKKVISTLIVVHAFGYPADVLSIKKICNKYNIAIIEDAAGGVGSYLNNQHLGTFTRFGILSFNGYKIVTSGMGGALLI